LGVVVGAGLLCELVVSGRVVVDRGCVVVVDGCPPGDAVAHEVLAVVLSAERVVPVAWWVARLGGWGGPRVVERLVRDGRWCRVVEHGRWGRRRRVGRVVPVEGETVCAGMHVGRVLRGEGVPEWSGVLGAGLILAAGLGRVVPEVGPEGGAPVAGLVGEALRARVGALGPCPGVGAVAAERQAAESGRAVLGAVTGLVGDAVLGART